MKITINSKDLLKGLQVISGVIKGNHTMPILDCILFELKEEKLSLTADNLEIRSCVTLGVKSDETYSVCIPHQQLVTIAKGFPDVPIQLQFNDKIVKISTSGDVASGEYEIPVEKAIEFPKAKYEEATESIDIKALDLVEALKKVLPYVDEKSLNPAMQCALIHLMHEGIKVVGGSGFVMYEYSIDGKASEMKLLLSKSAGTYLASSVMTEEVLNISYNNSHIFLKLEDREMSAVLGNGTYPPYESVLNNVNPSKTLNVDRDSLFPALRRLSSVTDKMHTAVNFNFKGEELVMFYNNSTGKGTAKETTKIDYQGEPFQIGFNAPQLTNVLTSLDGDIQLGMVESSKPCLVTADHSRCVVMPMKS